MASDHAFDYDNPLILQWLLGQVQDEVLPNDRDALLTVLSRNHGKLTVKARGLRRKNSPLVAPCQLLAYGEFTLFEYRGQYTIKPVKLSFFLIKHQISSSPTP